MTHLLHTHPRTLAAQIRSISSIVTIFEAIGSHNCLSCLLQPFSTAPTRVQSPFLSLLGSHVFELVSHQYRERHMANSMVVVITRHGVTNLGCGTWMRLRIKLPSDPIPHGVLCRNIAGLCFA
ncbi:hypothetical protein DL95DRAFT_89941 [Leptodontidium sp. 2 PMI_412]|nr:hypothetical protein DL95DRAFT_89941 [Leptodontidium sp. 2 PMI_412]